MLYSQSESRIISEIDEFSKRIEMNEKNINIKSFAAYSNIVGAALSFAAIPTYTLTGNVIKAAAITFFVSNANYLLKQVGNHREEICKSENKIEEFSMQLQREVKRTNIELDYVIDEGIRNSNTQALPEFNEELENSSEVDKTC